MKHAFFEYHIHNKCISSDGTLDILYKHKPKICQVPSDHRICIWFGCGTPDKHEQIHIIFSHGHGAPFVYLNSLNSKGRHQMFTMLFQPKFLGWGGGGFGSFRIE